MKNKGWQYEPIRHSLSSRGISTAFGKSKVADFRKQVEDKPPEYFGTKYTPYRIDNIIKLFWWCSIHNNWKYFEFSKAFDTVEQIIHKRLKKHLFLPKEEQREVLEEYGDYTLIKWYGDLFRCDADMSINTLYDKLPKSIKSRISKIDFQRKVDKDVNSHFGRYMEELIEEQGVREAIISTLEEKCEYIYLNPNNTKYNKLRNMYKKLKSNNIENKIDFFDKIIHTEHKYGSLFQSYVKRKLRGKSKNTIKLLRQEFVEEQK